MDRALREKVAAAERNIASVRAAVIFLNIAIYFLLMDPAGTIPWLAWTVSIVAGAYAVYILLFRPYEELPLLTTSVVTSVSDATLITAWIVATGGVSSPFYVLWYVSIVAIAFRYPPRETMVIAGFYIACYVGLLAAMGELGDPATLIVRNAYILFVGGLSGLLSGEAQAQTAAKFEMSDLVAQTRAAEGRFRRLLESAPDAILISDPEGQVALANTRAEDLFACTGEQLLGRPLAELVPGLGSDRGETRALQGSLGQGHEAFECVAQRTDGAEVPIEVSSSLLETEEGPMLSTILRDITQRKRVEEELEEGAMELRRSNAELEQFAYVASHDLQEPLRMVSSYVQLLQRRYGEQLDEDAHTFIGFAVEGVDRMHGLIRDLLTFSRVGREAAPVELVDTEALVGEVLANVSTALDETGATVETAGLPKVLADRSQLAQLFQNLITNALKFRGDGKPHIRIEAERRGHEYAFAVIDDGIGISPEYQEKIFLIFQRLHSREEYPGTGLGLAICRKIVERHGGRIWVESDGAGTGAAFRFTLPVHPAPRKKA